MVENNENRVRVKLDEMRTVGVLKKTERKTKYSQRETRLLKIKLITYLKDVSTEIKFKNVWKALQKYWLLLTYWKYGIHKSIFIHKNLRVSSQPTKNTVSNIVHEDMRIYEQF